MKILTPFLVFLGLASSASVAKRPNTILNTQCMLIEIEDAERSFKGEDQNLYACEGMFSPPYVVFTDKSCGSIVDVLVDTNADMTPREMITLVSQSPRTPPSVTLVASTANPSTDTREELYRAVFYQRRSTEDNLTNVAVRVECEKVEDTPPSEESEYQNYYLCQGSDPKDFLLVATDQLCGHQVELYIVMI